MVYKKNAYTTKNILEIKMSYFTDVQITSIVYIHGIGLSFSDVYNQH